MPLWLAITLGVLSFLLGGGILVTMIKLIYRVGQTEERVMSRLTELETSRVQNAERIEKVLGALDAHCKDRTMHVNVELEEFREKVRRDKMTDIDGKLNLLLSKSP